MLKYAAILAIICAGCSGGDDTRASREMPAADTAAAATADHDRSAQDAGTVAQAPEQPSEKKDTPGSAAAAVDVVRAYYAAIAARDYARAYAYWADGANDQTLAQFRAGFAETARVSVETGQPGRIEPAAGSRYIEVPVTVRAATTQGDQQCFTGSYVLRRSVVTGATEAQRHWRIHSAELTTCVRTASAAADSVRNVVRAFGRELSRVSLLAPPDVLRRDMRARYGSYVTASLLDHWLKEPDDAPGRTVSSPWPARIEIEHVQRIDGSHYRVSGSVAYVTSAEFERGGSAARSPVALDVVRVDDAWRLSSYHETAAPHQD